jgi:hypothetical protein
MIAAWKQNYMKMSKEMGGGDFLAEEFQEEIETVALPYIRRLQVTKHISEEQMEEFIRFCFQEIKDLHEQVREEG